MVKTLLNKHVRKMMPPQENGSTIANLSPEKRDRLRQRFERSIESLAQIARIFCIKGSAKALHAYADKNDWVRKRYGVKHILKYKDQCYKRPITLPVSSGRSENAAAIEVLQKVTQGMWKLYVLPKSRNWWGSLAGTVITEKEALNLIKKGTFKKYDKNVEIVV